MLPFLFHTQNTQKAQKAHKKHKNANKQISDPLPLRCFLRAFKTLPFLFLFAYMRFSAFLCV